MSRRRIGLAEVHKAILCPIRAELAITPLFSELCSSGMSIVYNGK